MEIIWLVSDQMTTMVSSGTGAQQMICLVSTYHLFFMVCWWVLVLLWLELTLLNCSSTASVYMLTPKPYKKGICVFIKEI
jgi:hypothetical protein